MKEEALVKEDFSDLRRDRDERMEIIKHLHKRCSQNRDELEKIS